MSVCGLCGTVLFLQFYISYAGLLALGTRLKIIFSNKNKYRYYIDKRYEGKRTRHYIIYSVKRLMLNHVQVYIIIFYNFMIYYFYSKLILKLSYVLYFYLYIHVFLQVSNKSV